MKWRETNAAYYIISLAELSKAHSCWIVEPEFGAPMMLIKLCVQNRNRRF